MSETSDLIGRKLYIRPDQDEWLEQVFGPDRLPSYAVQQALDLYRVQYEAEQVAIPDSRSQMTVEQINHLPE